MADPNNPCAFCTAPHERVIAVNHLAFAINDGFPVTKHHALVMPKRHVSDYFDLTPEEVVACHDIIKVVRGRIMAEDPSVKAFNVGVNAGAIAGQTVWHCHFHVIPRREGDVPDPRGGVRHVLPSKEYYAAKPKD